MAFLKMSFSSSSLTRTVNFQMSLPNDITWGDAKQYERPMKVLFLLHGYTGFEGDWFLSSDMYNLSCQNNMAVICPAGENSFYTNGTITGRDYATFLGEELPAYLKKTFGMTVNRENATIGGYSMGGYGALLTALRYPDTFGHCFALSSALIEQVVQTMKPGFEDTLANYEYYKLVFGDLSAMENSMGNPREVVRQQIRNGVQLPEIFMACGTSDFLIENNRSFHAFLQEQNIEHTYIEDEGDHCWDFWGPYSKKAVKWALDLQE